MHVIREYHCSNFSEHKANLKVEIVTGRLPYSVEQRDSLEQRLIYDNFGEKDTEQLSYSDTDSTYGQRKMKTLYF